MAYIQQKFFLMALEAGNSKIMASAGSVSDEGPLPGGAFIDGTFLHTWWKGQAFLDFIYNHFPKCLFPNISKFKFQDMNFVVTSTISSSK